MKKVIWIVGVALGAILNMNGLGIVWAVLIALAVVGLLNLIVMAVGSVNGDSKGMKFSKGNKLTKAAAEGDIEQVKNLLQEGKFSDSISDALISAGANGKTEMVQFLIKNGADVNFVDVSGFTPLALASTNADIARILLENGAEVNKINQLSNGGDGTALIIAAEGNYEVVKILLKNGADVNYVCKDNMTALTTALQNNQSDIACLLLKAGANPNCKYKGFSPLMWVVGQEGKENIKLVEALLAAGADVNYTFSKDMKPSELAGRTTLMAASLMGNTESVKNLLAAGVDVNHTEDRGTTALMFAAANGYAEIVQILLENGADTGKIVTNESGTYTAMRLAKANNHNNCVKILSEWKNK